MPSSSFSHNNTKPGLSLAIPSYPSVQHILPSMVETRSGKRSSVDSHPVAESSPDVCNVKVVVATCEPLAVVSATKKMRKSFEAPSSSSVSFASPCSVAFVSPSLSERESEDEESLASEPEEKAIEEISDREKFIQLYQESLLERCTNALTVLDLKRKNEMKYVLKSAVFGRVQFDINAATYVKLFRLAFDVFVEQSLSLHAIYRALHVFDRYLSICVVRRQSQYLILCACIMLSCKFDDVYPPCVDWIVEKFSFTFTKDELFTMEKKVFQSLDWDISLPTRYEFSLFFCEGLGLSDTQRHLVQYLLFLSFLDFNCHYFPASQIAAAALHLTLQLTAVNEDSEIWPESLVARTMYSEGTLVDPVLRLRALHWHAFDLGKSTPGLLEYYCADERQRVAERVALQYQHVSFVRDRERRDRYALPSPRGVDSGDEPLRLVNYSTFTPPSPDTVCCTHKAKDQTLTQSAKARDKEAILRANPALKLASAPPQQPLSQPLGRR